MSERQCRICFDGAKAEGRLGRLIRPCRCKRSAGGYAHIQCLNLWRLRSSSSNGFFICPECHYRYRCSRTQVAGLAENQIVIGSISCILFTCIVLVASFVTTYFMDALVEPNHFFSGYFFYISPFEVGRDLVSAAFRIIRDGELADILSEPIIRAPSNMPPVPQRPPGMIQRFIRQFLIGLPLVGAGSIVHVLLSLGMLAPAQFIARYRAMKSRKSNHKDLAALIVVGLLIAGAIRALFQVYRLTDRYSRRALSRIEAVILEVN